MMKKYMMEHPSAHPSWCTPYISDNGKTAYVNCNGIIQGMCMDGKNIKVMRNEMQLPYIPSDTIETAAKLAAGDDYGKYTGYTAEEILRLCSHEIGCSECTYFNHCDVFYNGTLTHNT